MTFNNSSRKNIREAEKAAELADTNRIAYTRQIMSTTFGRAWMHDLLLRCHIFHTPFVAGAPDTSAFNCGAQNLGLQLFGDVAANCPHEYTLMMSESSTKEAANDRRNDQSDSGASGPTGEERGRHDPQPASAFGIDNDGFVSDQSGDQTGDEAGAFH